MRYIYLASAATGLIAAAIAGPAQAGDTILYADPPTWVDVAELPPASDSQGSPLRLAENQTRMEDGVVSTYGDLAFALDTSQALNAIGSLTISWMPDKGDLTVHRLELIRGDQRIDLLANGARFEVLRREQRLEQRILDGALTATLSVPGAEIGDVLRYSYTTTTDEQVLDDDMESVEYVPTKPAPIAAGRVILSWPEDEDVRWNTTRVDAAIEETTRGGYHYVTIPLPAAEPIDIPFDAPPRFRLPPTLRATTFGSYTEISADIAPYFATEGTIEPGGALAGKVSDIAQQSADPLERAALATRFVQDEIGYLLDGLDGGNYIPQSPEETWEARTGDCKAKSLLLLAMLRQLGISAEPVLVHSQMGDALPELLPALANFDHIIVRADIGGTSYWLDGTNSGLRLANMIEVPRFRYALPLREGGASLQEMAMRPQAVPTEEISIRMDQSAGLALPAIYDITMKISGADAHGFQALSLIDDAEQKEDMLYAYVARVLGEHQAADMEVDFDGPTGIATITAHGLITSKWDGTKPRFELDVPYQALDDALPTVDRSRPEIADLPVNVRGPVFNRRDIEWKLPEGEYRLLGKPEISEVIGGTRLESSTDLQPDLLRIKEEVQSLAWEVPASELPEMRREALRLDRTLPRLRAPADAKRAWEYLGADRQLLKPIEDIYAKLVADADEDDTLPLINRYSFHFWTGDFAGARKDMDAALARDVSADNYVRRADALLNLGELEAALADYAAAARIDADYSLADNRLNALALLGRADEALALIDENAFLFEDLKYDAMSRASVLGLAGRADEALALLEDELAIEPDDADLLNSMCWESGVNDRVTEETLAICTSAVEKAQDSANAIDSRALAYYRLGQYDAALRDLDDALTRAPAQQPSRYLRGLVKRALGREEEAQADLDIALHAAPAIARMYSAWGLPPR